MEYDEDAMFTDYVWSNYSWSMTEIELVGRIAQAAVGTDFDKMYVQRFGELAWKELLERLQHGYPTFRKSVRDRLLSDCPESVEILRCPRCGRIVKTPRAKQCLWCGHDWHTRNNAE